jgi:iron complex transport system ATP-binding protein
VIRFDDVVVRYPGAQRDALAGVSLEALRGRITAVVGPNGSGKSTLIRALTGRVALSHGHVAIDRDNTATMSRREVAKRVAVVPQREDLAFPADVRDYVALGRFPHLGAWHSTSATDRAAIDRAIHLTGIEAFTERRVDSLSGGEWQRVRLARALAQGGQGLLLDEPTAFLDIGHEMLVFELLAVLAREGHAVLLVSHQLNLVARFAEQIVLLHAGRVRASGTADDVMQAPILEDVYEWPLVVTRDPAVGAPSLLPLRSRGRGS